MRALALVLATLAAGCLARIDDALIDNGDRPPASDAGRKAPPPGQAPDPGTGSPSPEDGDDGGAGGGPQPDAGAPDGSSAVPDHLVGHWTFEEGTGTTSADLTSGHHNAHLVGTTWTQGYEKGGVKLAGAGFVDVPGIPFPTPGTLSLRFLLAPVTPTAATLLDNPSTTRNHISVAELDTSTFLLQSFPTTGSTSQFQFDETGWHQIVLVWTSASVHVYVDGESMGSVPNPAGWTASEQLLRLATNMSVTLDDVRLYDVDLPPTSVP